MLVPLEALGSSSGLWSLGTGDDPFRSCATAFGDVVAFSDPLSGGEQSFAGARPRTPQRASYAGRETQTLTAVTQTSAWSNNSATTSYKTHARTHAHTHTLYT